MRIAESICTQVNIFGDFPPVQAHYRLSDIGHARATLVTLGVAGLSDDAHSAKHYFHLGEQYAMFMKQYIMIYGIQETSRAFLPSFSRIKRYLQALSPLCPEEESAFNQENYEQFYIDQTVSAMCRHQQALERLRTIEEDADLRHFIKRSSQALSAFLAGVLSMTCFIESAELQRAMRA